MKPLFSFTASSILIVLTSCNDHPIQPESPVVATHMVEKDVTTELKYNSQNQIVQLIMTTQFPNGAKMVSSEDFVYDDTGKMAEITSNTGFRFVYHYEGDLIVKTDEYVNEHLSQTHQFTYDQLNRVTEYITYQNIPEEGGTIPVARNTYTYDVFNNVLNNKLYYYSTGGVDEKLLTEFTFSEYDNHLNSEVLFEPIVVNPLLIMQQNNPGKLEVRNGNGVLYTTEYYTYGYNDRGYPVVKNTTANTNGQSQNNQVHYFFQ